MENEVYKEIEIYNITGVKGFLLNNLYDNLKNIRPTSVEAERAFSAAGLIVTKIRAQMKSDLNDSLCFLRSYFLNESF